MTTASSEVAPQTTINSEAPIILAGKIEIDAAPERVWDVLTTIDEWPSWNPDVKAASLEGDLATGSVFYWRAGPAKLTSTLLHVEPAQLIAWKGKSMGLDAIHSYTLKPRGDNTIVQTEESVDGVLAHLFKKPLRRSMSKSIANGLRCLKAEVEGRATPCPSVS